MNNKTMLEIRDEIGDWATRNFPPEGMLPELGIVEEIGEACHCILKQSQGIRGYRDAGKFHIDLTDALADCGIFALHFCYLHALQPPERVETNLYDRFFSIKEAVKAAATLIDSGDRRLMTINIPRLFNALASLGAFHGGIDLFQSIRDTWEKVSQRNWKDNPNDADNTATVVSQQNIVASIAAAL